MKTLQINLYEFSELSDSAKENALSELHGINVDSSFWYEGVEEEVKQYGAKHLHFDIDRRQYCDLGITDAKSFALEISKNHGAICETWKTANAYLEALEKLEKRLGRTGTRAEALSSGFIRAIQYDYLKLLETSYDYLTSKEAIIETIEANSYTFTESGKLY